MVSDIMFSAGRYPNVFVIVAIKLISMHESAVMMHSVVSVCVSCWTLKLLARRFICGVQVHLWKCLSRDDKLSPRWAWSRSYDVFIIWQISVNISKTVQETDILTIED